MLDHDDDVGSYTINAELFNSSECWIVKSEILSLKILPKLISF